MAKVSVEKKKVQKKGVSGVQSVIKRSGRVVRFREEKIAAAVTKAFEVTGEGSVRDAKKVARKVATLLAKRADRLAKEKKRYLPQIEEIQDLVEKVLMILDFDDTAKAYILYREQHRQIRDTREALDMAVGLVDNYLGELDWKTKENANMAYSLQGLNNYIASSVSSRYWMNRVYPENIREAHDSGDFHIHDLQLIAAYCCGWDLQDLLRVGFTGVEGKVSCRPPKHLASALGQMVNFIYTLQGEAAGAEAFSNFDTLLAPFVRYDKLTYPRVKQEMQSFVFNMNVATRVGFQTPFSNITLDLTPPSTLRDEHIIIGGEPQKETYAEFQKEMDMINRAFAEVMCEGDASGRIFTFPIPTYNIGKDFDWEDKRFDPVWEMTAKYGIPYFANFVNSDMSPDDARSMCPVAGTEKVLIRSSRGREVKYSTIQNVVNGKGRSKEEYEIYSDGKFVKGTFNKFPDQKMLSVTLGNGHSLKMTTEHLNFVLKGERTKQSVVRGADLKEGMYLPYSLKVYNGEGGNADLGFFVGAYAGDGSFDGDATVVFSLEGEFKKDLIPKLSRIAQEYFGARCVVIPDKKTKLVTLKVHSRGAVGLCRDYVEDKKREKCYTARVFVRSQAFREGVLAGHLATEGGNRHRIYTSSKKMVETLNMLSATLGTTTSIYKDSREGRLGTEPNYGVLIYQLNRNKYGNVWFKKYNKMWVRIVSIAPIKNDTAFCFEVKNGEPMFTVGTTGILTHNCRLRLDNKMLRKRGGGLFGANPLTGSIGVVTINLPRLGYVSKNKKEFYKKLDHLMDLAKESLEIKRKTVEYLTKQGLYPYTQFYLRNIFARFGRYWSNHFSTIGLVGMNEALLNLIGKDITTREGNVLAQEILEHMRDRIGKYQKETENMFNLEATPAEGTSYRLALKDKELFSDIIFANDEDVKTRGADPYYTNSSQLPVGFTQDLFEALDLQDALQTKYTGGTVLHGFLGERLSSGAQARNLVRKVTENYALPYFSVTPTFSVCPEHGYIAGEVRFCPKCVQNPVSKKMKVNQG